MSPTYAIKSFGCQMNAYDAERIGELLEADGYGVADMAAADVVVLNTCHIREKAAEKVYSDIGRLRTRDGGAPRIVVAGCVAQAEGAEIVRRAPSVDVVVGPQAYHRLPALLKQGRAIDTDMPVVPKFDMLPARRVRVGASAFLTVQEGCDKFCTFCVVPYTRGGEVSRPADAVFAEARALAEAGARELTLLGQNVNAYDGGDGTGLADLIRRVAQVPGIARIRYMTSHPRDMTDALIDAHAQVPQLMPYLHLPVQAGSDPLLRRMNRAHTRGSYLAQIADIKRRVPGIAISGDFIVGFPGETHDDFEQTLSLVREVGYAQAYSFKYSPRPGTPAATMDGQVPEAIKDARLAELQRVIGEGALAFNRASVGRTCEVLFERNGRRPGQLIGKSPWLQSVFVSDATLAIGDIATVELVDAQPNSLEGRLVTLAQAA